MRDTGTGRGARVDIGAEDITIVSAAAGAPGTVELVAADLAALGADSLLIGIRTQRDNRRDPAAMKGLTHA